MWPHPRKQASVSMDARPRSPIDKRGQINPYLEELLPSAQEAQDYQENFIFVASQQGVAPQQQAPSLPRPRQPPPESVKVHRQP